MVVTANRCLAVAARPARIASGLSPDHALAEAASREVEHSGVKEQAASPAFWRDCGVRKRQDSAVRRISLKRLRVRAAAGDRRRGWLMAGPFAFPVALGRTGIKANKREGDGATPTGRFRLRQLWWRADRAARPRTLLPARPITRFDAWCEDPADRRYNRAMRLAPGAPGDRLWRQDHLYDLVIELDHNARPRVAGRGSAVFVHVARPGMAPTAGCIALAPQALRRLLAALGKKTEIEIQF
jgi:L,D-peptidoglycan transpeptidase YkuD (ErfK/YbiS/YcfS/YnhG family)